MIFECYMTNFQVIFTAEAYYLTFNALLAMSNGYIGNITMMFGPKVVKEEHQDMAAAFLIACLVLGCGVGSILSAPIVKLL